MATATVSSISRSDQGRSAEQRQSLVRHLSLPFLLPLLAGGCASARLTQFAGFAQAGTAYVKASQVVLDEAGTAAIEADSLILRRAREGLTSPEERERLIIANNTELRKRLFLLRQIGRHGRLLQSYFETLAALADSKAPETLGAAAKGVFEAIGNLSPTIKQASFKGATVETVILPATTFIVQRIKVRALEEELKARSKGIERELALQEAALLTIATTLKTDLQASLEVEETTEVIRPFATAKELDDRWVQRRREILQARVAAASADSAAAAASKLRESFVALVENRLTEPSIAEIIEEINSVLDLMEQVRHGSSSK